MSEKAKPLRWRKRPSEGRWRSDPTHELRQGETVLGTVTMSWGERGVRAIAGNTSLDIPHMSELAPDLERGKACVEEWVRKALALNAAADPERDALRQKLADARAAFQEAADEIHRWEQERDARRGPWQAAAEELRLYNEARMR